jgi:type II secretory pathway component PulM
MENRFRTLFQQLFGQAEQMFEQQLLPRYQALVPREQKLVAGLAVFLAVALPLFGLLLPLYDSHKAVAESVRVLQSQAVEAGKLADKIQGRGHVTASGNVMSEVNRIARSSKVRKFMTRIKPQLGVGGNRGLLVQMKSAPYRDVIGFISAVGNQGLAFTKIRIQKADSPGHVHLKALIAGS